ncbi:hypothetical protein NTGBS_690048 [Candidatus Nitrotoga sp. BS]|nr:hypothetical protein NTGBS_690048 [Candidatus Nitrotoga sp. BS]
MNEIKNNLKYLTSASHPNSITQIHPQAPNSPQTAKNTTNNFSFFVQSILY